LVQEAFRRRETLEIDCSSVAKADVTSIQLLLSAARTGQTQGRRVVLTSFSEAFRNTLRRAGFLNEGLANNPFNDKKDGSQWPQS
jgi:ABC-type transporter Mla MlaB component